jgi:ABC-type branched-subunit amino acid transport system ATPase component
VSKRFGGLVALDALDLEVEARSVVGLIGPNGSGKTTFFNVLSGILRPSGGEIFFSGRRVDGQPPQKLFQLGIARTFQRSRLNLSLSVFENLALGCYLRLNRGLLFNLVHRGRLADQFSTIHKGASELLATFNRRLADQMEQPAGTLSMIDRRRVEICRALISNPRLLLLDEPSAGMTHDETMHLMDDILHVKSRTGDLAIVIVEHEMSVIERITTKCLVLNFGRKIAEGTYAQVAADADVQQAYLGVT